MAAIKAASIPLHEGQEHHIDRNAFASLGRPVFDLFQRAVYFGLARATKPVGMDLISAVGHAVCELDIFPSITNSSSNGSLRAVGSQFFDGFGERRGDVRVFSGHWRRDDEVIRLLKLHGSTNWYGFRFPDWDRFAVVNGNVDHAKDEKGRRLDPLSVSAGHCPQA